jgi:hypothetical protein
MPTTCKRIIIDCSMTNEPLAWCVEWQEDGEMVEESVVNAGPFDTAADCLQLALDQTRVQGLLWT